MNAIVTPLLCVTDDCMHCILLAFPLRALHLFIERSRTETSTRDDGRTSRGGWISLSRSLRDERIAEMKRSGNLCSFLSFFLPLSSSLLSSSTEILLSHLVALLTGIPESSQELIQILRYEPGQVSVPDQAPMLTFFLLPLLTPWLTESLFLSTAVLQDTH